MVIVVQEKNVATEPVKNVVILLIVILVKFAVQELVILSVALEIPVPVLCRTIAREHRIAGATVIGTLARKQETVRTGNVPVGVQIRIVCGFTIMGLTNVQTIVAVGNAALLGI